jgi:hypothetical protein
MTTARDSDRRSAADRGAIGDRIAVVGFFGGTHVAASLSRAAGQLGLGVIRFDAEKASCRNRIVRSAFWRFAGRPVRLHRFSASVSEVCVAQRPKLLIVTGLAPVERRTLNLLRGHGIICVNYATDDPWNPAMRAPWYLRALPEYDVVLSTRRANLDDLRRLGCARVAYLPFGYDRWLCQSPQFPEARPGPDALFVGGADRDRVAFVTAFMRSGPPLALVGAYWERYPATRRCTLGHKTPEQVCALTTTAKVNLCLVRRANRDGHVMRSFEIAALGGCMLVEETDEHKEIFGNDGETVVYFRSAREAADRAHRLLADESERRRLAAAVSARIARDGNTYRDRLLSMLQAAGYPGNGRPVAGG